MNRHPLLAWTAVIAGTTDAALASITRGPNGGQRIDLAGVVVTLMLPGQRPAQGRFTPRDQA